MIKAQSKVDRRVRGECRKDPSRDRPGSRVTGVNPGSFRGALGLAVEGASVSCPTVQGESSKFRSALKRLRMNPPAGEGVCALATVESQGRGRRLANDGDESIHGRQRTTEPGLEEPSCSMDLLSDSAGHPPGGRPLPETSQPPEGLMTAQSFIDPLFAAERELQVVMNSLSDGTPLTHGQLLRLQSRTYSHMQRVDLLTKSVDRLAQGLRQVTSMQT